MEILMPEVGEGVTEATIVEWLVYPGNHFVQGQVLVETMTDKVAMEIEAEMDGVLKEIIAEADAEVRIGALLARFDPA